MAIRVGVSGIKAQLPSYADLSARRSAAAASAGGSASASAYAANRRYAGLKKSLQHDAEQAELDRSFRAEQAFFDREHQAGAQLASQEHREFMQSEALDARLEEYDRIRARQRQTTDTRSATPRGGIRPAASRIVLHETPDMIRHRIRHGISNPDYGPGVETAADSIVVHETPDMIRDRLREGLTEGPGQVPYTQTPLYRSLHGHQGPMSEYQQGHYDILMDRAAEMYDRLSELNPASPNDRAAQAEFMGEYRSIIQSGERPDVVMQALNQLQDNVAKSRLLERVSKQIPEERFDVITKGGRDFLVLPDGEVRELKTTDTASGMSEQDFLSSREKRKPWVDPARKELDAERMLSAGDGETPRRATESEVLDRAFKNFREEQEWLRRQSDRPATPQGRDGSREVMMGPPSEFESDQERATFESKYKQLGPGQAIVGPGGKLYAKPRMDTSADQAAAEVSPTNPQAVAEVERVASEQQLPPHVAAANAILEKYKAMDVVPPNKRALIKRAAEVRRKWLEEQAASEAGRLSPQSPVPESLPGTL